MQLNNAGIEAFDIFRTMTPKQHVTAQLLNIGLSESAIAARMGVSRNTVKLHVKALYRKLGIQPRAATARADCRQKLLRLFMAIEPRYYQVVSGGLPVDWAINWCEPDPHSRIYQPVKKRPD